MSTVLSSQQPIGLPTTNVVSDLAAITRARTLVATLGGRYSLEFGVDADSGSHEVERWALAATLLCGGSSPAVAVRTFCVLDRAGLETVAATGDLQREDLVELLESGGDARDPERAASRLQRLARAVDSRHGGRVAPLGEELESSDELERTLAALPGWGPVTARTFLRELRGVWLGATPRIAQGSVRAAEHVHLPVTLDGLGLVALVAHLDLRDLEVGLVRLAVIHDFASCPGGEECPLASFDPDEYVHF